jgi:hypothetical protein
MSSQDFIRNYDSTQYNTDEHHHKSVLDNPDENKWRNK